MYDLQTVRDLFNSARHPKSGKPVPPGRNTRVCKRGDGYALQLHSTDVATFNADGTVTLRDGGWRTATTRARLNEIAGVSVWQNKGIWYLLYPAPHYRYNPDTRNVDRIGGEGVRYIWESDITLHPNGAVTRADGSPLPPYDPAEEKRRQRDRARVKGYADQFIRALYNGKLSGDTRGDCLYCQLTVADGPDKGKGWGESVRDGDHIRCHIKEAYYVPSLLYRALEWQGSMLMRWEVSALLTYPDGPEWEPHRRHKEQYHVLGGRIRQQITQTLYRYCLRELGLAY